MSNHLNHSNPNIWHLSLLFQKKKINNTICEELNDNNNNYNNNCNYNYYYIFLFEDSDKH
jgi:hypothetical protein